MDHRKDQSRRIQHDICFLHTVIFKIVASDKIHIFMQSIQWRDQILSWSGRIVRFTCGHVQTQFMEERLQVCGNLSACLFLNISSAIRKNFLLVNIPDLFHIGTDGLIKYFLSVNLCFYITGCRMNLSHLRIFIHIWSFRPDCFVSILTADLFVLDPLAEISDIFFAFISFENDFISFNSKLFYQNIFYRIQFLQIADRKIIPLVRSVCIQIVIGRGCTVLIQPVCLAFRQERFEINLNLICLRFLHHRKHLFNDPGISLFVCTDNGGILRLGT